MCIRDRYFAIKRNVYQQYVGGSLGMFGGHCSRYYSEYECCLALILFALGDATRMDRLQ